jgi:hypothetical protein
MTRPCLRSPLLRTAFSLQVCRPSAYARAVGVQFTLSAERPRSERQGAAGRKFNRLNAEQGFPQWHASTLFAHGVITPA